MAHLDTHSHTYTVVRPSLTPWQMAKLISGIRGSERFELGDYSHIHLKGTDICVGYLGDESAELVDPDRAETRSPRKHLKRYFRSA